MNGFSSAFTDFCAGRSNLDQVIAALEMDFSNNPQSTAASASLIEFAWQTGKLDEDSYATLREIVQQPVSPDRTSPVRSGWQSRVGGPARDWGTASGAVGAVGYTDSDETMFRPADRLAGPGESSGSCPRNTTDADAAITNRSSRPSAGSGWLTNPSQWSGGSSQMPMPGTILKDRFVLEEVIGRGGMGLVFRAKDRRKEEAQDRFPYVAVKVLNEDFRRHPDSLKALQREARKAQSLAHENVAAVYDFDRDGSSVFLVMDLLEGTSLEKLIKERSRRGVPPSEMFRIVRGLGAALSYAHSKGVVHCDFKPANCFHCSDGSIKVFDFGIARAIRRRHLPPQDETNFDAGTLGALTPAYASCELLLGEDPDPRDDVFALACVAYELLTGNHPFNQLSALIAERRGLKPEPISGIDRRTWRALVRGLTFTRKDRTPSVEAFVRDLEPKLQVGAMLAAAATGVAVIGAAVWIYRSGQDNGLVAVSTPGLESAQDRIPGRSDATSMSASRAPAIIEAEAPADLPVATQQKGERTASSEPTAAAISASILKARRETARSSAETTAKLADATSAKPLPPAPLRTDLTPAIAGGASSSKSTASNASTREFDLRAASVEVLKRQLIANASANEITHALDALRVLESRLPPDDDFLREYAPQQIGRAYARLGDESFARGGFDIAVTLYDRAQEIAPDDGEFSRRKDLIGRTRILGRLLESGSEIAIEPVQARLKEIAAVEDPAEFASTQRHLAGIFASRIQSEQLSSPKVANDLLRVAQEVFPDAISISALEAVQGSEGSSTVDVRVRPFRSEEKKSDSEAMAGSPDFPAK